MCCCVEGPWGWQHCAGPGRGRLSSEEPAERGEIAGTQMADSCLSGRLLLHLLSPRERQRAGKKGVLARQTGGGDGQRERGMPEQGVYKEVRKRERGSW